VTIVSRALPFFSVVLLLLLASCDRSHERIVGKWKVQNDASATVWEFAKNGEVKTGNISGRYTFGDQNRIKIQTPFATFVYELNFTAEDAMVWKDPNGSQMSLKRVP